MDIIDALDIKYPHQYKISLRICYGTPTTNEPMDSTWRRSRDKRKKNDVGQPKSFSTLMFWYNIFSINIFFWNYGMHHPRISNMKFLFIWRYPIIIENWWFQILFIMVESLHWILNQRIFAYLNWNETNVIQQRFYTKCGKNFKFAGSSVIVLVIYLLLSIVVYVGYVFM